jgi:aminopeptidase
MSDFDPRLQRYAQLMAQVGLNVQPGQSVFIRATRGEPEFVYAIARAAYREGASLVHVLWEEDAVDLIRVQDSPREALDLVIDWYSFAYNAAVERGDALLLLHSPDPALYTGVDPERVMAHRLSRLGGLAPMLEAQRRNETQWSVCRVPTEAWARRVFPTEAPDRRRQALWDAIFSICRVDVTDPINAWREHAAELSKRREYLTGKQYRSLHLYAPQTDLTVGLPPGHVWWGGESESSKGIKFVANVPTEEIFTLPHRDRAEGHVTMTRPLSISGVLIDNFTLTFEHGRVTGVSASNSQEVLERLIASDEGAAHPGEIALVPASNPIARRNMIFYDGLFDENAASHLAVGRAYRFTLEGSAQMSPEAFRAAGGNDSIIHEDMMIGSSEMNVDGIGEDGTREPVMRGGEWAFDM